MDQIRYLKPDLHTEYLNKGKGQEATYLQIAQEMDIGDLRRVVENGAEQYREVLELAEKKPARFVILQCENREEGLMAVSYLAAVYNRQDADAYEDWDEEEETFFYEEEDEDAPEWEMESWTEDPWKIPVVKMEGGPIGIFDSPFGVNSFAYDQAGQNRAEPPYWYGVRRENICFIADAFLPDLKSFQRHQHNRHVFLILPKTSVRFGFSVPEEASSRFGLPAPREDERIDETLSGLVFEYQAEIVKIKTDQETIQKYYEDLFRAWVAYKGYTLERDFPAGRMAARITAYSDPNKSAFMEKVIDYVTRDLEDGCTLREKDFSILNRFRGLVIEETEGRARGKRTLEKLDTELIGLENVKEQIKSIVAMMRQNRLRRKRGLNEAPFHNTHMLLGAPGTAKTTVAKLLGTILTEEELLPGGRFISINGAELKGKYVGHSAPKVKELFENYDIILIDEAYSLASEGSDGGDSFSQEAVAQLVLELEEHGTDKLVLFAGYGGMDVSGRDNRMKQFLDMNPGIKSRINTTMYFASYQADQMVEIFRRKAKEGGYLTGRGVDRLVRAYFEKRVGARDFGNGREARSLLENAAAEAASRMLELPEEEITDRMLQEIRAADVKRAVEKLEAGTAVQTGAVARRIGFADR